MQKYQSHKIVEAARIVGFTDHDDAVAFKVEFENGETELLANEVGERFISMASAAGLPIAGGWLIKYPDLYISWSPALPFAEGYDLLQPSSGKSKIVGYRELTEFEVDGMNNVKEMGKVMGDLVEYMRGDMRGDGEDIDQRWVSIGATHLQQGLMALTRAIAKPEFF